QFHLALPFGKTLLLFGRMLVVAVNAAHPFDVMAGRLVFGAERLAAGAAELIVARLQAMTYRDALIEHEAVAAPQAAVFRYRFQILENATFQVIDLVVAQRAHVGRGFLAANATRAEHGHLALAVQHAAFLALGFDPAGKLSETA